MLKKIFPPCCFHCQKEWAYLCTPCKKQLIPHAETCPVCHRVSPWRHMCLDCRQHHKALTWLIIAFQYTWPLKQLIWKLKYNHARKLSPFLTQRIQWIIRTHPPLMKAIQTWNLIISHVPSHRRRHHMVKWYNQSQLLAQDLAHQLSLPHQTLRKKIKHTRSQATLSKKKRLTNLHNAYIPLYKELQGDEYILLIDDITTTWSTLIEVASCMKMYHPYITIRWCVLWRHWK